MWQPTPVFNNIIGTCPSSLGFARRSHRNARSLPL
jgi:hypothetical protein